MFWVKGGWEGETLRTHTEHLHTVILQLSTSFLAVMGNVKGIGGRTAKQDYSWSYLRFSILFINPVILIHNFINNLIFMDTINSSLSSFYSIYTSL